MEHGGTAMGTGVGIGGGLQLLKPRPHLGIAEGLSRPDSAVFAVQTRIGMLDRAEAEDATLAICYHSGFGKVVRAEGRRYWQGI